MVHLFFLHNALCFRPSCFRQAADVMLKASVIIPTKNPGPVFRQVLTSVLNQDVNFDYEVLVIDSGSTDGTLDYLSGIDDPRLRLHCIEPQSFSHGRTRNLGISM